MVRADKADYLYYYINNAERVQTIISPVIEEYKSVKLTYTEAKFNTCNNKL